MKCRNVIDRVSSSVDGRLPESEITDLRRHLKSCPECALHAHQMKSLKETLHTLPTRAPSPELTMQLRVIASHERALRQRRASIYSVYGYWRDVCRVWMGNLMRPVALPAAGGLLSTIFLFAMIAPMYSVSAETIVQDVPTELTTQAALSHYRASFSTLREDIVVDVMIDGNGRMVDYSVPAGQVWQNDPELRRCIENILICMVFTPATWFGKPASGTIRITVSSNQVDVQG